MIKKNKQRKAKNRNKPKVVIQATGADLRVEINGQSLKKWVVCDYGAVRIDKPMDWPLRF